MARPRRAAGGLVARRAGGGRRDAAAQAREAAWRYWRARALAAARPRRGSEGDVWVAQEPSSTASSRAEALGRAANAGRRRGRQSQAERGAILAASPRIAAFGARAPACKRAVKLAGLEMRPESVREWIYAIRGLDDDSLLLAAELR